MLRSKQTVVAVQFHVELENVPADYLVERVDDAITRQTPVPWIDQIATGVVRPMKWPLARGVLAHDDIYFGSSRMIELLTGAYIHEADHSMAAKWRPNPERPFYAAAVYQASIVSWDIYSRRSIREEQALQSDPRQG